MTSSMKILECWSTMALMTFPYFVLSAGLACIFATGLQVIGWMAGAVLLAVMLGVYRCFHFYFGGAPKILKAPCPVHRAVAAD